MTCFWKVAQTLGAPLGAWLIAEANNRGALWRIYPAPPNQLRFTTSDDWLVVVTSDGRWIEVDASLPSPIEADLIRKQLGF